MNTTKEIKLLISFKAIGKDPFKGYEITYYQEPNDKRLVNYAYFSNIDQAKRYVKTIEKGRQRRTENVVDFG